MQSNDKKLLICLIVILFIFTYLVVIYYSLQTQSANANTPMNVNGKTKIAAPANASKEINESARMNKNAPQNSAIMAKISFVAGKNTSGFADGKCAEALFGSVFGIAADAVGNIYLADIDNNAIRKISSSGFVATLSGGKDGQAKTQAGESAMEKPIGIAIDKEGNLLVAEYGGHKIRKIDSKGQIVTIAGSGVDGFKNGFGREAEFCNPRSIALDKKGNIYVADEYNNSIRKISFDGTVSTLAGSKTPGFSDGFSDTAAFNRPCSIVCDREDNLFVADLMNDRIRKISRFGGVSTIALKFRDSAKKHGLKSPHSLAIDDKNNLYVADNSEERIKVIDREGYVTAVSLNGYESNSDVKFSGDVNIALTRNGELIVSDSQKPLIRKIKFERLSL